MWKDLKRLFYWIKEDKKIGETKDKSNLPAKVCEKSITKIAKQFGNIYWVYEEKMK